MFLQLFLFHPEKLRQDYHFSFPWLCDEFFLTAPDGACIHGLRFPLPAPKGLILYFHGNADNLARWGQVAGDFLHLNYEVWMIDYRGFGKSTGRLSEDALHSDAAMFYDYALTVFPPEKIVIYGRSLGSALATRLASEVTSRQLILETPFFNLPELLLHYVPFIGDKIPWEYQFRSDLYIRKVDVPITIFHGTKDEVVPYGEGTKFEGLLGEKVLFITVEGGKHKNIGEYRLYHEVLESILGEG
ncbi:MAG: alpha/beta fold hydrolase [Bacteroidia bacterium]